MTVTRMEEKEIPEKLRESLQQYRIQVKQRKDNLGTHTKLLNQLIQAEAMFGCSFTSDAAITIIQEIYTNGLKKDSDKSHTELNGLMLGALFESNQPRNAVECYLLLHHKKITIDRVIHTMMVEMLCEFRALELLAKIYENVNLSVVKNNFHMQALRLCFLEEALTEDNDYNVQLVELVLTNTLNLELFLFAMKHAIDIKNLKLVKTVLNAAAHFPIDFDSAVADIKTAKDDFYYFSIVRAIGAEDPELVELIYQHARENRAASDKLYAAYLHSKTFLPPTYAEVLKRINQLENLLTINPDLNKQDLGVKNSTLVLLDAGVYQEIYLRIIQAARYQRDKIFLEHQFVLAKLVCPLEQIEELTCALIRAAVNCGELKYAWEIHEAGSETWSAFANNFELLQHLTDMFIFHDFELLDQAYNQTLYLLHIKEEEFSQLQNDLSPLEIENYFNSTKDAHHKIIRAMGRLKDTLEKAFIIYKNLCEYQRGQLVDWPICSYIIMQACHLGTVDMAFGALSLAKKVLDDEGILQVRREILRITVSNPFLLDNINEMLFREITEIQQLKKSQRPEEEYSLEAQRPTLSQCIIAGLAGTAPPNDEYSYDENSYDENSYYEYSSEEEYKEPLDHELFEPKKEIEMEVKHTVYPIQPHQPKKPPETPYVPWTPACFRPSLTFVPDEAEAPTVYQPWLASSFKNSPGLPPSTYTFWQPSSFRQGRDFAPVKQEESKTAYAKN